MVTSGSAWASSRSSRRYLRVQLFSPWAFQHLQIRAPFTLAGEIFRAGIWQLQAHQGQLFLRGGGQPRRYLRPILLERATSIQIEGVEPRRYRGVIQIGVKGADQIQLINWIELEEYLLSVVPSEMPFEWPASALAAQAIAARTIASPYLRLAGGDITEDWAADPYLLQDSTADQFYGGMTFETPETTAAVRQTRSLILVTGLEQRPIEALYHSTCGGHTSANQVIFAPPAQPYLQGVQCQWCHRSPFYGPHETHIPINTLIELFGSPYLEVLDQDPVGRPIQVQVGAKVLTGQAFWLALGQHMGWGVLPSNRYQIQARDQDADGYTVQYRGAGHGVGLCQWGAKGLAEAGRTESDILSYYYPGTKIIPLV